MRYCRAVCRLSMHILLNWGDFYFYQGVSSAYLFLPSEFRLESAVSATESSLCEGLTGRERTDRPFVVRLAPANPHTLTSTLRLHFILFNHLNATPVTQYHYNIISFTLIKSARPPVKLFRYTQSNIRHRICILFSIKVFFFKFCIILR